MYLRFDTYDMIHTNDRMMPRHQIKLDAFHTTHAATSVTMITRRPTSHHVKTSRLYTDSSLQVDVYTMNLCDYDAALSELGTVVVVTIVVFRKMTDG